MTSQREIWITKLKAYMESRDASSERSAYIYLNSLEDMIYQITLDTNNTDDLLEDCLHKLLKSYILEKENSLHSSFIPCVAPDLGEFENIFLDNPIVYNKDVVHIRGDFYEEGPPDVDVPNHNEPDNRGKRKAPKGATYETRLWIEKEAVAAKQARRLEKYANIMELLQEKWKKQDEKRDLATKKGIDKLKEYFLKSTQ